MARRLAAALCVVAGTLAACRTAAPPRIETVPDPLQPPLVGVPLAEEEARQVRAAVSAAERRDWAAAAKYLAALPPSHPAVRLAHLEVRFLRGEDVVAAALNLARELGGYAAAWEFAYAAAMRAGDRDGSLEAAKVAAQLRPSAQWQMRVDELEKAARARALGQAAALLARGDAEGALQLARALLNERPNDTATRTLAVRAALAARRPQEAAALVPALEDTPEGLELKGRVAEALGQWDLAADLFAKLPASHPNRCEMLAGAREQERLSNAPPHVSAALAATVLTRRGLAALLVWQAPVLATKADGPVVVFEDIVQIAERSDIVTVTRAGVMTGDTLARRFGPNRAVGKRELQATLERLAEVAGRARPHWCAQGLAEGCLAIPEQLSGRIVADLIREVAGEGGEPCKRR